MEKISKVLIISTVPSMIGQFNMLNINILLEMGYKIHVACNFRDRTIWPKEKIKEFEKCMEDLNVKIIQIDFSRKPFNIGKHLKAYQQLIRIFSDYKYDFVHCHTPICAAICRVAAHKMGVKVIYTAHGFHFYKGAPFLNWILYYPIEKVLAAYTEVLITITKEDYQMSHKLGVRRSEYLPGIGIDLSKFKRADQKCCQQIRDSFGISSEKKIILSVGELNRNKNQKVILKALASVNDKNIIYMHCGQGGERRKLEKLAEDLQISEQVKFLGYQNNIIDIYRISDIFVFPSKREGLSVSIMEAMASGLPVICSNIRGNTDLIETEKGGYCLKTNAVGEFAQKIAELCENQDLRKQMKEFNQHKIENFDMEHVCLALRDIYASLNVNYVSDE